MKIKFILVHEIWFTILPMLMYIRRCNYQSQLKCLSKTLPKTKNFHPIPHVLDVTVVEFVAHIWMYITQINSWSSFALFYHTIIMHTFHNMSLALYLPNVISLIRIQSTHILLDVNHMCLHTNDEQNEFKGIWPTYQIIVGTFEWHYCMSTTM